MLGRAADIAVVGYNENDTGADKAKKSYTLWKSVRANPPTNADRFQMEPTADNPFVKSTKNSAGVWNFQVGGPGEAVVLADDVGASDGGPDGVPDYFENSDHLHIQDNP